MFKIVDEAGNVYSQYTYPSESEFERMVVAHIDSIFGEDGIYFDIKKLIGKPKKGAAIPDGYYLDLTFHTDPRLYLVEVELNSHDVYGHIGEQLLRFGIASEMDKYKMKTVLLSAVENDPEKQKKLNDYYKRSAFNNNRELLDRVIYDQKPAAIVIIDEVTEELYNVMAQLTMFTDVLEAQTYLCGAKKLYRFTPFRDEVLGDVPETEDADKIDTIVVPAREDGFAEEFLKNARWYAIRISEAMLDKIKYIAAYQVAPVSGITHIAEVDRIERYDDTNKYILYFKDGTVQEINKVGLGKKRGQAPQAPRYASHNAIMGAKTLDDLWS